MAPRFGMSSPISDEDIKARLEVWEAHDRNTSATARELGLARSTIRLTVQNAMERGILPPDALHEPNPSQTSDYLEARERKIAAYQRKKRKGDWRKPVVAMLPERPFRLKVFGDPHIDSDGCNFELFERHWLEMDASRGILGISVGDWFDNWLRALGHLWKDTTTAPSDAWLLLEHLMEQNGEGLIAACSGNHDDWAKANAPVDPVDLLMKRHGVLYRQGAIRVMVKCGDLEPFFIAIRHKWRGSSMYSAAHWGVRANREGWRDLILVGGHIHQDEPRLVSHPDGMRSHVCQVSAFKEFDTFKDVQGFNGPVISPVWDLVIDPRRPDTCPDKVKVFWDSDAAQAYLEAIA